MGNTGQNTTWKIHGLDTTINYYYSVQTIDNGYLASEFTSEKIFVFEPNSIDEIVTGINIYPNPTNGLLMIELSENSRIDMLKVIDITGSEVISRKINESTFYLNLSGYPDGIYLIRAIGGRKISTMRIIKY